MALQGFSHIGICVSDLERSTAFYEQVLGFSQVFSVDFGPELAATMESDSGFTSRMLARDDFKIELLAWRDTSAEGTGDRRPMTRLGVTHLAFRVEAIDDLYDVAKRCGGAVHHQTRSDIGADVSVVYLTDPDGIRIECMAGVPALG